MSTRPRLTDLYDGELFISIPLSMHYAICQGIIRPNAARLLCWWLYHTVFRRSTLAALFVTREAAEGTRMDPAQVKRARQELIDLGIFEVVSRDSHGQYILRLNVHWRITAGEEGDFHTPGVKSTPAPCDFHTPGPGEIHTQPSAASSGALRRSGLPVDQELKDPDQETDSNCSLASPKARASARVASSAAQSAQQHPLDLLPIRWVITLADRFQQRACQRTGHSYVSLFQDETERAYLVQTLTQSMWPASGYPSVDPQIFACALRLAARTYTPMTRHRVHIWRVARGICRHWYDTYAIHRADQLPELLRHLEADGVASWPPELFDPAFADLLDHPEETAAPSVAVTANASCPSDITEPADFPAPDVLQPVLALLPPPVRGALESGACEISSGDNTMVIHTHNALIASILRRHVNLLRRIVEDEMGFSLEIRSAHDALPVSPTAN